MSRSWVVSILVPVVGLALACGGRSPSPQTDSGMDEAEPSTEATGRVAVVGNTPFEQVVIRRDDAADLQLQGPYRDEIRRLSGATIRVSGEMSGQATLTVADYEIVEIAGREPIVGILERTDDGYAVRVADEETVTIRGVPAELRERVGAKIWVTLGRDNGVQAYGVIRAP